MNTQQNKQTFIRFSIIESEIPSILTKTIYLDKSGVKKQPTANLTKGKSSNVRVDGVKPFSRILKNLKFNQSLVFGVTDLPIQNIVTKNEWEDSGMPDNPIPRTADHFHYPIGTPAILSIDYDPSREKSMVMNREQLVECLSLAIPSLEDTAYIWWPSASSFIVNTDTGEELSSLRGQRLYIPVLDGQDIPRAGKVLFDRLFLNGKGRYEVSRTGRLLERSIIDSTVWQPNKLDFASGAYCMPPLKQQRGDPVVKDGVYLDTKKLLPDLNDAELIRLKEIKSYLKSKASIQQSARKRQYVQEKLLQLSDKTDAKPEYIETILKRAVEKQVLTGDFLIALDDGVEVSVSEILKNKESYHGRITKDPLEPEYDDYKNVGRLFLTSGVPTLHSFAHGETSYQLIEGLSKIRVLKGATAEATDKVMELMACEPDFFDRSSDLIKILDGKVAVLDEHSLGFWLSKFIQFVITKTNNKGESVDVEIDPPAKLLRQVLSLGKARVLKQLKGVINVPTITPSGRVINTPGYDEQTGLYLYIHENINIDLSTNLVNVKRSVELLMKPFNSFPFKSNLDRAAMLSAVLTAIVRPVLKTSPGFAFDAPVQGSGKTKLARCIALLCNGGNDLTITPHTTTRDDEEIRKRLLSLLRNGKSYVIWDNVLGIFDSASIAGLLTSDKFSDRILGKNSLVEYDNTTLFLITGNNLQLAGDMPRRIITCRIDPESEKPYAREFDFDPEDFIQKHRMQMAVAVIQVIAAFFHRRPNIAKAAGRMASFEQWDDVVRQTVNWINHDVMPGQFGDVMEIIDNSYQNDPELEMHSDLLVSLEKAFGNSAFKAADIINHFKPELAEAKEVLEGWSHGKNLNARSIGRILKFRQGKIVNGRKLVSFRSAGSLSYKIEVA